MADKKRIGFGQVEPNHLSAMRTHQIYAQLPAKSGIAKLENGQFAKYDYANGCVDTAASANGEYMLVLNEVKLYDGYRESYKDFALQTKNMTDGKITPRLYKTNVGDIMTLNTFNGEAETNQDEVDLSDIVKGAKLVVGADGFLVVKETPTATEMVWQVVDAEIGMPSGVFGCKVQRIQ